MPIVFAANVPRWLRAIIRRWVRVLGYVDWHIDVQMASQEELRVYTGTAKGARIHLLGGSETWGEYLQFTAKFHEGERADALDDYAAHELLHVHYDEFFTLFDRLWDRRRKVGRDEARKQLGHLIEERIQRHVRQLQRARGRGGA